MSAGVRKAMLTLHLAVSIGWLGSVIAFLVLAIAGLTSSDALVVRGSYLAADLIMLTVIVPLSFASLLTGIVMALGTPWGLFRHYWVLISLVLNLFATFALLVHRRPAAEIAQAAKVAALMPGELRDMRIEMVVTAGAALLLLLVATTLNVYKPRGLTAYGWRKQQERRALVRAKSIEN